MTRILIFSDTHGRSSQMEEIISAHPEAKYVIHLGDCVKDAGKISGFYGVTLYCVCGNCDLASCAPIEDEVIIGGKHIFFTHGHKYSVKSGLEKIICEGRRRCADLLLFGHTHRPVSVYSGGMHILNPGSLSRPAEGRGSYGIIDICSGQIMAYTVFC